MSSNPDTAAAKLGELVYRPLTEADLAQAWALSQEAKWQHRLEDWRFMFALGRGEAVMDGEVMVGVAMTWHYGDCTMLGLIIVAASHRGRRVGSLLVEHALAGSDAPCAMLHATPAGANVYALQGFEHAGEAYQHQGVPAQSGARPAAAMLPANARLRACSASDRAALVALDRQALGMDRSALIDALLEQAETVVLEADGKPVGFSVLRRFGRGQVIGPVVAPDTASAWALVHHWLTTRADDFLRIDIPEAAELGDALTAAGLARVDTVKVMARGPVPLTAATAIRYALVSQALA